MRVYCRVKPLESTLPDNENSSYKLALRSSNPECKSCIEVSTAVACNDIPICLDLNMEKEKFTYHFDGVFGPGCS